MELDNSPNNENFETKKESEITSSGKILFQLFDKVTNSVQKNGTRTMSVVVGMTMILGILFKNLSSTIITGNEAILNVNDLSIILCGGAIITIGLIITSLEYKWHAELTQKNTELALEKYKLDLEFGRKKLDVIHGTPTPPEPQPFSVPKPPSG